MTQQVAVAGGAVTFSELVGAPQLSRSITATQKSRAETRHGLIAWANIDALFAECFPAAPALPGVHPSVSYLYVNDVAITPYPDMPAQSDLSCLSTNVNYTSALATIQYGTVPYDVSTLVSRRTTFSNEVMLIPSSAVEWDGGAKIQQADIPAGMQIPTRDIHLTYHNIPDSAMAALRASVDALIGHVNVATYQGFAAETLLYKGAEEDFNQDSAGDTTWSLTHLFKAKIVFDQGGTGRGWNYFLRESDSTWQKLVYKGTSIGMYPTASSAALDGLFA